MPKPRTRSAHSTTSETLPRAASPTPTRRASSGNSASPEIYEESSASDCRGPPPGEPRRGELDGLGQRERVLRQPAVAARRFDERELADLADRGHRVPRRDLAHRRREIRGT